MQMTDGAMMQVTEKDVIETCEVHGFPLDPDQLEVVTAVVNQILLSASKPAALHQPTEAMLNAARDWSLKKYGLGIGSDAAIGCWQAMLAAAPAQSGEAVEADVVPNEIAELLTEPCWNLSRRDVSDLLKRIGSILYTAPQSSQPSAAVLDDERAAFRTAIEEMVVMLENGEWAEHVAETIVGGDELASRLEAAITELHNDIGEDRSARAASPQATVYSLFSSSDRRNFGHLAPQEFVNAVIEAVRAQATATQPAQTAPYLPCPTCKGVEGCDHTVPERTRAAERPIYQTR
jgi:AcrR family transcriptional regulator